MKKDTVKKIILSAILFVIGFVGLYVILCIHYKTDMMWIPEISARQKILEYIQYKPVIKILISTFAGVVLGAMPFVKPGKKH